MIRKLELILTLCLLSVPAFAVELYDNSTEAPHLDLIQSARSSIDIEIYTMDDPQIRNAILHAQEQGVRVRIVQEPTPVGASCHLFEAARAGEPAGCSELRNFVAQVRSQGGEYVPFNKGAFCGRSGGCYEHGKILIVDQRAALISTGNFDPSSICDRVAGATRCNRDFSAVTDDPDEVRNLEIIFENDLSGQSYDLGSFVNQLPAFSLTVSPYSLKPLVDFIGSARRSIQIENQYLKDPDLNQAIEDAARRGVVVQVMVSSICSFGKPSPTEVSNAKALAQEFINSGVDARVFTGRIKVGGLPGYLHAKTIVVDQQVAWVGSVNGSVTALSHNREYGIFFQDSAGVSKLSEILSSDFGNVGSTSLAQDSDCQ